MSQDLARRAVACGQWRWLSGMLTETGYRVLDGYRTWPHLPRGDTLRSGLHFPDLTDPATVGCLLALVRDSWEDPHVYVLACASDWWTVCSPNAEGGKWLAHPPIDGSTEAEALVAALEAAP